jgi:hypothetical protein
VIWLDDPVGIDDGQQDKLNELLVEQCEENLGMPMAFTLHAFALEWAETIAGDNREHAASAAARATQAAVDAELERMTAGTVVTPESFAIWRAGFDAEMSKKPAPTQRVAVKNGKFTGKELFKKDARLISSDEALSNAGEDALASVTVDVSALDGLDLGELDAELDGLDDDEGGAAD